MKKGIILITLLCSILMCSRVKATTYNNVWVGDWRDNYDTFTNNPTFSNLYQYKTINSGDYYFTNLYMTNSYNAHGKNVVINGYIKAAAGLENTYQCSEWYDGGNTLHCDKWTSANGGELSVNLWVINDSNPCVIEWTNNPYTTDDEYKFFQATCHTEVNVINRVIARVRFVPNTEASYSLQYDFGLNRNMKLEVGDNSDIINNQNQNTQNIINGTLADTPSQDFTNETQELNDYSTAEEQVLNSLDFSGVNQTTVTINPNASLFIWNIVDRLRSMSGAIVLLMTSIFGIGIIKLVLNR